MGQDVPLHHPYGASWAGSSITEGSEASVKAGGFFSEGLLTLPEQLQRVGPLLKTHTLSSPAQTSLHAAEGNLTWQKSGSGFGGMGEPALKVMEPYSLGAPPPIEYTEDGTEVKVSLGSQQ